MLWLRHIYVANDWFNLINTAICSVFLVTKYTFYKLLNVKTQTILKWIAYSYAESVWIWLDFFAHQLADNLFFFCIAPETNFVKYQQPLIETSLRLAEGQTYTQSNKNTLNQASWKWWQKSSGNVRAKYDWRQWIIQRHHFQMLYFRV